MVSSRSSGLSSTSRISGGLLGMLPARRYGEPHGCPVIWRRCDPDPPVAPVHVPLTDRQSHACSPATVRPYQYGISNESMLPPGAADRRTRRASGARADVLTAEKLTQLSQP